jgi:hypothetical protein
LSKETLFSSQGYRTLAVTLGALLAAVVTTAAMPLYLPLPQTDSIGIPILFFPLTWLLLFLFSAICHRLALVWLLQAALVLVHGVMIYGVLS